MELPNVSHVTVGEKISRGRKIGRRAIKFYVTAKHDLPWVGRVPPTIPIYNNGGRKIGEVETDVVLINAEADLFGFRGGHSLVAFDNDLGVCALTFVKGRRRYAVTNSHVVQDVASGQTGEVAWLNGLLRYHLGPTIYRSALSPNAPTAEDAALVRIESGIEVDDFWLDLLDERVDRLDDMRQSDRQHWFVAHGQLYTCAEPEPVDLDCPLLVDGIEVSYRNFWQLVAVGCDPRPGISGALLCRTVGAHHVACGLVFGGVPGEFIWAFSFRTLFNRLLALAA